MKKRILISLMILMNILLVVPANGRYYNIGKISYYASTDGTATVHGPVKVSSWKSKYISGNVTIPTEIKRAGRKYKVTRIAKEAFAHTAVEKIIIPNSVREIGDEAFKGCSLLREIVIPSSVKMGTRVFDGCYSLKNIVREEINDGKEQNKNISPTNIEPNVDKNIPVSSTKNDKTFAVIIANENYNKEEKVPYAVNDGNVFSEYCSKTLGIPVKNIHFVKDASLNDIRHEVNWITNVMEVYDGDAKAIFYYAGHGIPDEETKTSYILPVDGYNLDVKTGYSLNELYSTLGGVSSKSVIVLLDACFSGAKRDGTLLASSRGVAIKVNQENPVGNLIVFSASQGDETAFPYVEQGHGMFTYFILKKLQETKGNVTMGELSDYVTTQVKRESTVINSKTQHPTVIPAPNISNSWRSEKLK